jgi:ABC-type nickel/cobalt efflux system permease component RcnA
MTSLQMVTLSIILALIAGCADGGGATASAGAAINTVCPMMGGKVDGKTNTVWNGQTIGFCCPPCIDAWNELSDEERKAALAEAAEGHGDHSEHDHAEHAEADHAHDDHEDKDAHGDAEKSAENPAPAEEQSPE